MSVTLFAGVTFQVDIAFATAPLATTPTWTDVSAYVREVPSIFHGRTSEFGTYSPSTLTLVLANGDRRFDPEHASGPYFGDLLPMKKIRVKATYNSISYTLFVGFITGWPQSYNFKFDSTVTIQAVDGSRFLEQAKLQRSAYEAAVLADSPVAYWPMQEESVARYEDTQASIGLFPVVAGFTQATSMAPIGAPLMSFCDPDSVGTGEGSLLGALIADQGVDITCVELWTDYSSRFGLNSLVEARTQDQDDSVMLLDDEYGNLKVRYSNIADNRYYEAVTSVALTRDNPYHLAVRATSTTITVYVNGTAEWSQSLTVGTSGFTASSGAAVFVSALNADAGANGVSHVAVYTTAPSAARITEHYIAGITAYGYPYGERSGERIDRILDEIGWPTADRDIGDGDTVQGPYIPARQSAMAYMRGVETSEDGLLFFATDGDITFRDRQWQWRESRYEALTDEDGVPLLDEDDQPIYTDVTLTFTDDGTGIDYTDLVIDANSVDVVRATVSATYSSGTGYLTSEDATTLADYGPATEALSVPTIDTAAQARALTAYKLRQMKDPRTRITSLMLRPRGDLSTMAPAALGLQIGRRAIVEITPQDVGSVISKTVTVQGFEHVFDRDLQWETKVYLGPAIETFDEVPYLVMGDATYGQTGAVAGNQVAF